MYSGKVECQCPERVFQEYDERSSKKFSGEFNAGGLNISFNKESDDVLDGINDILNYNHKLESRLNRIENKLDKIIKQQDGMARDLKVVCKRV